MKKLWNWLLGRKKQQKKVETVQPANYYKTIDKMRTNSSTITPPKTSAGYSRDDNWGNDMSNPMNPLSPMYIGNTWDNSSHNHSNSNDNHYSSPVDHSSHHSSYDSSHSSYDSSSNYSSDSSSYDSSNSYDSSSSDSSSW